MSKKKSHYSRAGLVFEELEPRLLLSADPLAVATDADGAAVQQLILENDEDHTAIVQSSDDQSSSSVRNELVIIDSRAPNYQQLYNDLIKTQQEGRNIHIVVLDAHRDGIDQINEALSTHDKLDAVHIVSHGDDGQLQLGATQFDKITLRERSSDINQWKDAFSDNGDLLLYGCELAETSEGKKLINALSYLTATDVAASDDLTGHQLLGGDWELEYEAGDIETSVAFSDDIQQQWQGTLEAAAQAGADTESSTNEEQQQEQQLAQLELEQQQVALKDTEQSNVEHEQAEQEAAIAEEQRQEIVFVDESVGDYLSFIDDLQSNSDPSTIFDIVLLDGNRNGIDQVSETLSAYDNVDALHLVTHASDGALKLGNTWLNNNNIEDYHYSLSSWGHTLDQDADILIYGCNLAEGSDGQNFVAELAQLTSTDIAVSTDITGHALLGGDWDLEYKVGAVETTVAFSEALQQSWTNTLNTYAVTSTADSGPGSLRQAILNANANAGVNDTITFNIAGAGPHVINLASALPTITDTVTINGSTEPDYAGDPVVRIDGAAAGAGVNGLTFAAGSDQSVIRGLMITNFTGYGIQIDAGADRIRIVNNWIGTSGTGSTGVGNSNSGINIQGANTTVGGSGSNDGNVITNNGNEGINVTGAGATGTVIQGNIIGLDPDGATGSGNTDVGIALLTGAHNTVIGGTVAAERNIISNNVEGIEINSNNNLVQGNYIGTDISGTLDRGNRSDDGVEIQSNATGNLIGGTEPGAGNLIAFNARDGVYIANGTDNTVLGNTIHSNAGMGIDLGANGVAVNDANDIDTGANQLQNFPVLSSVLTNGSNTVAIDGTLNSTASTDFRIEFFASAVADGSGNGEAERYLGSVNVSTDGSGNATFSVDLNEVVANGEFITATATVDNGGGSFGNTSEFAQNVSAALTTFAPTLHDWYDSNWDSRKAITIDSGKVDANLTDFPVLISLNADADLAAFAQADGDDILFTSADGTKLAHEIESFDAGTGALTAWVRTDLSAVTDTTLFLYYGNAAAANQQDAANVWDSHFMGVWHLNDTPTGAPGDINDSTANNNDGTTEGGMNAADSVSAKIGTGLDFDEVDDLIRMQDSATLDSVADAATIELWVWFDNSADGDHQFIMSSSNRFSGADGYEWASQGSGDHFFYPDAMAPDGNYNLGPNPFTDQQWQHLAVTLDFASRDVDVYVDGVAMDFSTEGVPSNWATLTSSDDWLWGGNPDRASRYFDGMMDEIRVSDVVRSQAWIQTSINNQSDPSAFFTLGTAESRDLLLTVINENDSNPTGDSVADILNSGGGDRITDVDAGAQEGIAVIGVDDSNGQWQYDATGGGTWVAFGAVSDASAVLLNTGASIRFVPAINYNGPAGDLTFRAWDQTSGANGDTGVNVSVNGGTTAYSSATSTASLIVNPVNSAPVATNDPGDYNTDIVALNPDGYWRLGETSGPAAVDDGSTGNNGTYNSVTLGQAGAIAGDADSAVSFDGIDDYIEIPHDNSYLLDDGTLQLWFNTANVNQRADLFSKDALGNATGGHLSVYLDGTGNIEARLQSATASYFLNSTLPLVNGQWHHVAVNFGAGGLQLYIDGQLQDSDAYTGGLGTTSGGAGNYEPIVIGSSTQVSSAGVVSPLQDYYTGLIDEVALFGSALTADQIQDLYASALQNYTIAEDTSLTVTAAEGVLINDSDVEGDSLTAVLVAGPTNAAAFNLNPDGSFSYTPVANFSGTDSFTYRANDGSSNSNLATVTITVTADNDAPVNTVPGTQTVFEDTQTAIAGISVADPDAAASVITTQLSVSNGVLDITLAGAATISAGSNSSNTLTISGNVADINATLASLQYTGNTNVNGIAADTLTVVTNDQGNTGSGGAQSDTDNVQIDITALNDLPFARDDRIGLMFDGVDDYVRIGAYPGLNVSTNLTMEAWIKPTGSGSGTQIIVNKEGEYEMAINATTGEVMWAFDNTNPDWNWHNTSYFVQPNEWTHLAVTYDNGVVNTFANGVLVDTYIGSGAIVDNYPGFNELQIGGRENAVTQRFDGHIDEVRIWNTTQTQFDIQSNMNTLLTGAEAGLIGNWRFDEGSGTTVEDRSVFGHHGMLADGVTVAEMPAWHGYVVSEEGTLNVSAVNGVLANDYDIDGDPLTAVLDTGPANAAAFSLNPDGSFTYTPDADFYGIDTFTYHANDGSGDSNIATVTIRVDPVNDAPLATNLNAPETYIEDTPLNLTDIVVSDVDSANVSVTLTLSDLAAGTLNTATSGSVTSVFIAGIWSASGAIADVNILLAGLTFTPALNYNSNFTILTSVDDGIAPAVSGSKTMTGTPVNDLPVATANTVTTPEDTAYNFSAADFTFSDVESDSLVSATITNIVPAGGTLTHSSGTAVNNGDTLTAAQLDTLVYTPPSNTSGAPLAGFDFSVNDAGVGTASAQMAIDVTAVNDAPVANTDAASVSEGGTVMIDLALNDTDVDNALDLNSITITSAAANGSLIVNGNGTVTYTHDGSETVSDSFSYTIADISGAISNTATVNITVNPVNDAPVAVDDAATVAEGNAVLIDLAVNDNDVDNALDLNSITIIAAPANGTVLINGDGTVTYTHDGSGTSSDSFTYTIADISGDISNTATVNISVTAVNDVPTTSGIADVTVNEDDAPTTLDLNAAFDDVDNPDSELTYSIVGNSNIGLFSLATVDRSTGQLTLEYAADMNGSAQISIRASDPTGASVDTLFTVTVIPVNDNPVLQANTGLMTTVTAPATISNGELNVTDIDNLDSELVYTITALPANGELLLNGVVMVVNDSFTQADLDSNLVEYRPTTAAAADQFGFSVSDSAGGSLANNTFEILVQLSQDEDGEPVNELPPDYMEEEAPQQETTETDSANSTDGAGGYGGGFEPVGSSSVPPVPAPQPVLSIDPVPQPDRPQPVDPVEDEEVHVTEVEDYKVSTFSTVQVKSMHALWSAIDSMKQEMANAAEKQTSAVEIKVAAAETSGVVLTAGVVAWILRSGALFSSLISTIPLWKGYDPLPILAYNDDDDDNREEDFDENKIPTSMDDLKKLKKLIKDKHQTENEVDVDSMFGGTITRE